MLLCRMQHARQAYLARNLILLLCLLLAAIYLLLQSARDSIRKPCDNIHHYKRLNAKQLMRYNIKLDLHLGGGA